MAIQGINRVDLFKSVELADLDVFNKYQVRIGDTDNSNHGRKEIQTNTECGGQEPRLANRFPYHSFLCAAPMSGRFLIVQHVESTKATIAEIEVYTDGKYLKKIIFLERVTVVSAW